MKTKFLMLGLALSIVITSCSKKDDQEGTTITADEASINNKLDVAIDDVAKVIEEELQLTQKSNNDNPELKSPLEQCPAVTRVPEFGAILVIGQAVAKTIDFGTGCVVSNNNVLKGKIVINYFYDPVATTRIVTYTFLDFFHNKREINGTKTFTITFTPSGSQVAMEMNLTMTLSTGQTITRIGTRTRTQTAGFNTPLDLNDNVYQIEGNWTTTYPNNQTQTSTITSPLIIKLSCLPTNSVISAGIITFARNGKAATLDYGDGSCDKTAVFTYKGVSFNITITGRT